MGLNPIGCGLETVNIKDHFVKQVHIKRKKRHVRDKTVTINKEGSCSR